MLLVGLSSIVVPSSIVVVGELYSWAKQCNVVLSSIVFVVRAL